MLLQLKENMEPIPGYRLTSHLGAGGYGEVWRAEAPGGLQKAIKVVFGQHDQTRAETELKSLHRVRDVRHPFLLSLERIEIINGQLLIVTELAEGSLRERFTACKEKELSGIPREELLGYIRDAADALDFMSERFSLQHLDVKPENLLLLSGHVKVADFGLVKNIQNVTATMVSSLTPVYSAPEVFRGAPSHSSDQYSLAILYQEMLTGILPFSAESPAQYMLKHLGDEADVSPLDAADRKVMRRALSKQPLQRFKNCREFAEELFNAGREVLTQKPLARAPSNSENKPRDISKASSNSEGTIVCDAPILGALSKKSSLELPELQKGHRFLPVPEEGSASQSIVPTLFIGVGSTGGLLLKSVRRQLAERFGVLSEVPVFQTMLVDTDTRELFKACRGDDSSALDRSQVVALPLKRPMEYRQKSKELLKWLNRRWLYNLPRSLRTEGLRPLGRLGFIDHFEDFKDRLQSLVQKASSPESMATSNAATLNSIKSNRLRVFVLGSINGATGSAITNDIAFAVKGVLESAGVASHDVTGVLTHSIGINPKCREISRVNAYAWMEEYNHFHRPGGMYPGDASVGLGSFEPNSAGFDSAYVVDLGEALEEQDWSHELDKIAGFLCRECDPPARNTLHACRNAESSPAIGGQAQLRTLGTLRISLLPLDTLTQSCREIAGGVLRNWIGANQAPKEFQREFLEWIRQNQLTADQLISEGKQIVARSLGCGRRKYLEELQDVIASNRGLDLGQAFHQVFSESLASHKALVPLAFGARIEERVGEVAQVMADKIVQWLALSVTPAGHGIQAVDSCLGWLLGEFRRQANHIRQSSSHDCSSSAEVGGSPPTDWDTFQSLLDDAGQLTGTNIVNRVSEHLSQFLGRISEARRNAELLVDSLALTETQASSSCNENKLTRGIRDVLYQRQDKLVDIVDTKSRKLPALSEGIVHALELPTAERKQLLTSIKNEATLSLRECMSEPEQAQLLIDYLKESDDLLSFVPPISDYGGEVRLIAIVPRILGEEVRSLIRDLIGQDIKFIEGTLPELYFIAEVGGLSLSHVALETIEHRSDLASLAERVRGRSDVPWNCVTDGLVVMKPNKEGSEG